MKSFAEGEEKRRAAAELDLIQREALESIMPQDSSRTAITEVAAGVTLEAAQLANLAHMGSLTAETAAIATASSTIPVVVGEVVGHTQRNHYQQRRAQVRELFSPIVVRHNRAR